MAQLLNTTIYGDAVIYGGGLYLTGPNSTTTGKHYSMYTPILSSTGLYRNWLDIYANYISLTQGNGGYYVDFCTNQYPHQMFTIQTYSSRGMVIDDHMVHAGNIHNIKLSNTAVKWYMASSINAGGMYNDAGIFSREYKLALTLYNRGYTNSNAVFPVRGTCNGTSSAIGIWAERSSSNGSYRLGALTAGNATFGTSYTAYCNANSTTTVIYDFEIGDPSNYWYMY